MKLNKSNNLIITELNNENESDSDKTKKGNKLKSKKENISDKAFPCV